VLDLPAASEKKKNPSFASDQPLERTVFRRAVEAVICGMPLVNTDAMRQAYFWDVGANYNDIYYFSKPAAAARRRRPLNK
jgi:hypothetical protein